MVLCFYSTFTSIDRSSVMDGEQNPQVVRDRQPMPTESDHEESGVLDEWDGFPVLARDDGGPWRLHLGRRHHRHIGRRVRITGQRDGFDWLAVTSLRLEDDG